MKIKQYYFFFAFYFLFVSFLAHTMESDKIKPHDEFVHEEVFEQWHESQNKYSLAKQFDYRKNTNDFGLIVKEFIQAQSNDTKPDFKALNSYYEDMKALGKQLGFKVTPTKDVYMPRDHWVYNFEGRIVSGKNNNNNSKPDTVEVALIAAEARSFFSQDKSRFRTNHSYFKSGLGIGLKQYNLAYDDYPNLFGTAQKMQSFMFYFEGGNHLVLSNKQGQKIALIGQDLLHVIYNQFLLNNYFNSNNRRVAWLVNKSKEISKKLKDEEVLKTAQELFYAGMYKIGNQNGLINEDKMLRLEETISLDHEGKNLHRLAIQEGAMKSFPKKQYKKEEARAAVSQYLAQREMTHDFIAYALGVESPSLIWLKQIGYHIDVFLRPGPKGSILMQDFSLIKDQMQYILEHASELELSQTEIERAQRYKNVAETIHKDTEVLSHEVSDQLKKAGFDVIPTAGWFLDDDKAEKPVMINLLNAVSGYSEQTKRFYIIAGGATLNSRDRLGRIIMDLYVKRIQQIDPNIDVFFIGRSPEDAWDFSGPIHLWSGRAIQAGLHCLTFEKETEGFVH